MTFFRRPAVAWGLFLIWAGAIWYGSTLSLGSGSPFRFFGVDKLGHAVEFGFLGMLAANALLTLPRFSTESEKMGRVLWSAVAVAGVWGLIDEIHQIWVPGRTTDPFDLVADVLGASIGAWIVLRRIRPVEVNTKCIAP